MTQVLRWPLIALGLIAPLMLGACNGEDPGATAAEQPQDAFQMADDAPAPVRPAAQGAAAPARTPAPPPPCTDCGTVVDVRSYQVKGQASGVGAAIGAVAGGLLGNQIGGGSGKKIATVAGAVGGGVAGHEVEKRRNSSTQWEVAVQLEGGTTTTLYYATAPGLSVGQKVRVVNGQAVPM
jgi:outer membrane lipoprotein SlyB